MTDGESKILDRLDMVEEALKMILVNDVLKDAEMLTGQTENRFVQLDAEKEQEYQKKIEALQNQIEAQKNRIQTLQQLSDSKERTIQIKEERILSFQKQLDEKAERIQLLEQTADCDSVENWEKRLHYLRSQIKYIDQTDILQEAKSKNALRIGAVFRLPLNFHPEANGKVWRITQIFGTQVMLTRNSRHHNIHEEIFNIGDILPYYEPTC